MSHLTAEDTGPTGSREGRRPPEWHPLWGGGGEPGISKEDPAGRILARAWWGRDEPNREPALCPPPGRDPRGPPATWNLCMGNTDGQMESD